MRHLMTMLLCLLPALALGQSAVTVRGPSGAAGADASNATPAPSPSVSPTAVWHPNDDTYAVSGSASFAVAAGGTVMPWVSEGKSVIRFNGSTKYDMGTDLGFPASYTFIFAIRFDALGSLYIQGSSPTTVNLPRHWGSLGLESDGDLTYYFGDNSGASYGSTSDTPIAAKTWHVVTMQYTTGNTACVIRVDGVAYATTPASSAASAAGGDGVSSFRIGHLGNYTAGNSLVGQLGDWYFWNSAISGADISVVEQALMTAYGVE